MPESQKLIFTAQVNHLKASIFKCGCTYAYVLRRVSDNYVIDLWTEIKDVKEAVTYARRFLRQSRNFDGHYK